MHRTLAVTCLPFLVACAGEPGTYDASRTVAVCETSEPTGSRLLAQRCWTTEQRTLHQGEVQNLRSKQGRTPRLPAGAS